MAKPPRQKEVKKPTDKIVIDDSYMIRSNEELRAKEICVKKLIEEEEKRRKSKR